MSLPGNTGRVLEHLGFSLDSDFIVSTVNSLTVLTWVGADPQPTEEEINTTASSQAFLDWEAEHGGNETLTKRRVAKEAISTPTGQLLIAFITALKKQGVITGTKEQIINAILAEVDLGEAD